VLTAAGILAYRVEKRPWEGCHAFIFDLRERLAQQVQITSDGYAPYAPTIRAVFGWDVDYGQLQKIYETDQRGDDAARRYSPERVVAVEREVVFGNPEEAQISTSFVERNNLTIRIQMRRFIRLTNAFSKKAENHAAAVALHVGWYNLCDLHEALRVTPAMALGVTDHPWTISELVERALSAPTPRRFAYANAASRRLAPAFLEAMSFPM